MPRTLLLIVSLFCLSCGGQEATPSTDPTPPKAAPQAAAPATQPATSDVPAQVAGVLQPLVAVQPPASQRGLVDLGRMLYYEERLSAGQNQSCNSCHGLDTFGVDNEPTSLGSFGDRGGRNSPTTYNAFGHIAQFWDGRSPSLVDQAKGPILNPVEMAMPDEASVVNLLKSIPGYVTAFQWAYPGSQNPVTYQHMAEAIGAFERYLLTPSPVDAWLKGEEGALSAAAKKGAEDFITVGCTTCHFGPLVGGGVYMKMGLVEPYATEDLGRFEVTGNEVDKHVFKVPSLRNIAKTGPYLHDGSVADLAEVVRLMAKHQLGRTLDDGQVASIVAFLEALTGELPTDYVRKPELPANGPNTPGPLTR